MKKELTTGIRRRWRHYLVAALSVIVVVVGGVNLALRKDYGFEAVNRDNRVIVSKLRANGPAEESGVKVGDRVLEVAGRPIANECQMRWVLIKCEVNKSVPIIVERDGDRHEFKVSSDRLYDALFIFVALLGGFSFFAVGQLIWWYGGKDPMAMAFFLGFLSLGITIALSSWENFFRIPVFHFGYSFLFLMGEASQLVSVTEGLIRLGNASPSLRRPIIRIFTALFIIVLPALFYCYYSAFNLTDPVWTVRMEWWFYQVFNPIYELAFFVGLFSIALCTFRLA